MKACHEAAEVEMVTVATRRVELDRSKASLLDFVDTKKVLLLPNTAGCFSADEAVHSPRLAREVGLSDCVKLEVLEDQADALARQRRAREGARRDRSVKEGFTVVPVQLRRSGGLSPARGALGAAAVMPLGAPIGSGLGIRNPHNIALIVRAREGADHRDAGLGCASDAAVAMEIRADGVIVNTAVAGAEPVPMARAMRDAVRAGRDAFLAGRIPKKWWATASSPASGMLR